MACRNEARHIRAVLDSLLAQQVATELIVADGMSDDGTREVLNEYAARAPRLRVIDNPGKIVSTGLNAAINAAAGDIILRMDAHTEYAPDYVRACVEVLWETGADNVGGPARTKSQGWLARAIAAAYHSRFSCGGARFHDENYQGPVDTVPYGCWRRSTFQRLGGFDETLVRNQDDEFNLRLIRAGGRIWQSPRIVSWYSPRASLGSLFRQYFQYGFWKVAVIRKHRLPASWRHLVPAAFVAANVVLLFASALTLPDGWPARLWLLMIAIYFACAVAAAVQAGMRRGWSLVPVLPLVFAVYHISYGLGFLLCSLRFPGRLATAITR
jgi:succinoglycan biosynthesis protein ExoA